jgi:hypothetical protein
VQAKNLFETALKSVIHALKTGDLKAK